MKHISTCSQDPVQHRIYYCDYTPNIETLASDLGETEDHVRAALAELVSAGFAESNRVYFVLKADWKSYRKKKALSGGSRLADLLLKLLDWLVSWL